jgi:hypothetical protein
VCLCVCVAVYGWVEGGAGSCARMTAGSERMMSIRPSRNVTGLVRSADHGTCDKKNTHTTERERDTSAPSLRCQRKLLIRDRLVREQKSMEPRQHVPRQRGGNSGPAAPRGWAVRAGAPG